MARSAPIPSVRRSRGVALLTRRARRGGEGRRTAKALRLPRGCTAHALSDAAERERVTRWVLDSPDHTLYHLPPYIDFLREQNGVADVLLLEREGTPLLALPIHGWDATGIDGGYSGVLFPATSQESALRRSVSALVELLSANRGFPIRLCQSAQAWAYDDLGRVTLLQCLLESEGIELDQVYGWLVQLDHLPAPEEIPVSPGRYPGAVAIDAQWLASETLGAYDHSTRKNVRSAIKSGLTVEYVRADEPSLRAMAYERFQPVHEESWARTGLLPKPPGLYPRTSEVVTATGGEDLVVLVLDRDGQPLAGMLGHTYRERALGWSGCSSNAGLRLQASPLCMHGMIVACRREGMSMFELGRFRAVERSAKARNINYYKAHFATTLVRITSFSSTPTALARIRAARAGAIAEAKRRLAVALARSRINRQH